MLDSCCPYISISRGRGSPPRVTSARWKTNTASTSAISDTLTLRQGVLIQNQSSEFFYVISIQCGQSNMQAIRWNRVDLWDNVFLGSSSKTWIAKHPSNQADNVKPPPKNPGIISQCCFCIPQMVDSGASKKWWHTMTIYPLTPISCVLNRVQFRHGLEGTFRWISESKFGSKKKSRRSTKEEQF